MKPWAGKVRRPALQVFPDPAQVHDPGCGREKGLAQMALSPQDFFSPGPQVVMAYAEHCREHVPAHAGHEPVYGFLGHGTAGCVQ